MAPELDSESWRLVGLITAGALLIVTYLFSQRRPKNFPPGPWGFPVLGHLPLLGLEPHKTAATWISKYGPIVGVDFASYPCVIISDYKLAKEAYADPAFSGRPKLQLFSRRSGGIAEGIVFSYGRTSKEQRGFTHRRLRQLGSGTKSMESILLDQALELVEGLRSEAGHPISTHCKFNIAFWNTLWALIAGEPFKQSDPKIFHFTKLVVDGFADVNIFTMLSMFIPWFANNFPNWLTNDDRLFNIFQETAVLFQPYIDEHKRTRVAGEPRDFIDAYLDEVEKTTDAGSSFHESRSKHSLMSTLMDLFIAGIETTGNTFSWICLLLASYPDVQERLSKEIRTVIGSKRLPSLNDRPKMPYTEAVLHEAMRKSSLVPLAVFHSTLEAVHNFHGYDIPKDTMIYINLWEVHNNKELWGDPENFRPERWLNEKGEFVRREGFLAFSTGKRVCIGEQLGRDQLFLFTTALFQVLKVAVDEKGPKPSLEPKVGGTTLSTRPHELVYTVRA